MRKIKLYALAVAAALLSVSCLDKYPSDAILANEAITTVDEANQAVIGIYAAWKSSYLYSGNLSLLPDIQADLVYGVNGNSNIYDNIWTWNILGTNTDIENVYGSLYAVIGKSNFLLEEVAKFENTIVDDEQYERLKQYKGEAYFSRALAYSELIKCFCKAYKDDASAKEELGVVLVSSYSNAGEMKRASLYDSYQFVLADLKQAAELLDPGADGDNFDYSDTAYFSYYTVLSLYARTYLYMNKFDEAIDYSSKVIDSNHFRLASVSSASTANSSYSAYTGMWVLDSSPEIIWKVGFTPTSYGGKLGQIFLNYDWSTFRPDYVPGQQALALYETGDLRYDNFFMSVQTGYSHALNWPILVKYQGNEEFIQGYNLVGVCMPKPFRLAEQYLIRAEAYCRSEKQKDFNKAAEDLATLRKARYQSYGAAYVSEDTWQEEISNERVRELFMEGFRLNDLKRWGKGFERRPQTQSKGTGNSLKIEKDNPLFVWPIPQNELDAPGSHILPNESNK